MFNRQTWTCWGLTAMAGLMVGCAQSPGVGPTATAPMDPAGDWAAERNAPAYEAQQAGWRSYYMRRRIALAIEAAIFTMVNQERAKAGLSPLTHVTALRSVARLHSIDMVAKSYFAHNSPDGKTPADRLTAAGIGFSAWAENIRWVSAPRTNVAHDIMYEAGSGWMNSPGHRANILNPNMTQLGVGVYLNSARTRYYATQLFIRP